MGRRRKKGRKKAKNKIPLLATLGLLGGVSPALPRLMNGELQAFMSILTRNFTGYDPGTQQFNFYHLKKGLVPLALGIAGSTIAAKTGANRKLSVPFVKL